MCTTNHLAVNSNFVRNISETPWQCAWRAIEYTGQWLAHIKPMLRFFTPWKHHKTSGFLTFWEVIEMDRWSDQCIQKNACPESAKPQDFLFKIDNKNTNATLFNIGLVSWSLSLNTFRTLIECFYFWHWTWVVSFLWYLKRFDIRHVWMFSLYCFLLWRS